MQKYMMFEDMTVETIFYPSGAMKTRDEVKADYPILATPYGVIGLVCDDSGDIGEVAMMNSYYNIVMFVDQYKEQIDFSGMTNAEKCEAITALVNAPAENVE